MSGCIQCGDCCREVCFPIEPVSLDWALLHGLSAVVEQGQLMVCAPIPCQLFDAATNGCKDYEHRPLTCKVYLCDEAKGP